MPFPLAHRQTLSNVSTSSMKNEAGQEALLEKMKELRSKLQANEQREKAALLKIKMLGITRLTYSYSMHYHSISFY